MYHGRSTGSGVRHQGFSSGSAPPSQADLGQGPSTSEPQFSHLCNGEDNKSTSSSRLLRGSFEIKEVESASSHIKSDTKSNPALANIS